MTIYNVSQKTVTCEKIPKEDPSTGGVAKMHNRERPFSVSEKKSYRRGGGGRGVQKEWIFKPKKVYNTQKIII